MCPHLPLDNKLDLEAVLKYLNYTSLIVSPDIRDIMQTAFFTYLLSRH